MAYGCQAGWRTFTGNDARFSLVIHVYGSDESKTYTWRVLLPWPARLTWKTSVTVSPDAIEWFPFGFPFLSNQSAWVATTVVTPALIARTWVVTYPAAARLALFVTFTVTVIWANSSGSAGFSFSVPASTFRSAWMVVSIWTWMDRLR